MIINLDYHVWTFVRTKFQDGNFLVMKSFVASICLRTFLCNCSFGVMEDEDKSTYDYKFTNALMISLANIRRNLQVWTKLNIQSRNKVINKLTVKLDTPYVHFFCPV